jgi:putative transposase
VAAGEAGPHRFGSGSRQFAREAPNRLWVTDITEHRTREGKVYCAVVLDTYSRRVVGWSIDSAPTAMLVTNALGMAIENRPPEAGAVIHSDQGVANSDLGSSPSVRSGSRMQVELLDRERWNTRLELANAIFEHLEIWHNRQRRHSALGWLSPIEFERETSTTVA